MTKEQEISNKIEEIILQVKDGSMDYNFGDLKLRELQSELKGREEGRAEALREVETIIDEWYNELKITETDLGLNECKIGILDIIKLKQMFGG